MFMSAAQFYYPTVRHNWLSIRSQFNGRYSAYMHRLEAPKGDNLTVHIATAGCTVGVCVMEWRRDRLTHI